MGSDCLHQHVVPNAIQGTYHGQEGHHGAGVQLRHQPLVQVSAWWCNHGDEQWGGVYPIRGGGGVSQSDIMCYLPINGIIVMW